jgi:K+-sensing histidine kinase KdpD
MAMERPDRAAATSGTILCGVDDSQSARDALQLAAALSERLRVRLVVAHVASRKSSEGAQRLMSRLLAEAAPAAQADARVAVGDRAGRLAQIAAEEGADLIIVGLGRGSRLRVRPGSKLASELESTTTCPVVIAPQQTRPRSQLRLARAARDTAS